MINIDMPVIQATIVWKFQLNYLVLLFLLFLLMRKSGKLVLAIAFNTMPKVKQKKATAPMLAFNTFSSSLFIVRRYMALTTAKNIEIILTTFAIFCNSRL